MKYEFIGNSYKKRVIDVNRIYDEHSKEGLTNREIFRKFIYPIYRISEKTFLQLSQRKCKIPKYGEGFQVKKRPELIKEIDISAPVFL